MLPRTRPEPASKTWTPVVQRSGFRPGGVLAIAEDDPGSSREPVGPVKREAPGPACERDDRMETAAVDRPDAAVPAVVYPELPGVEAGRVRSREPPGADLAGPPREDHPTAVDGEVPVAGAASRRPLRRRREERLLETRPGRDRVQLKRIRLEGRPVGPVEDAGPEDQVDLSPPPRSRRRHCARRRCRRAGRPPGRGRAGTDRREGSWTGWGTSGVPGTATTAFPTRRPTTGARVKTWFGLRVLARCTRPLSRSTASPEGCGIGRNETAARPSSPTERATTRCWSSRVTRRVRPVSRRMSQKSPRDRASSSSGSIADASRHWLTTAAGSLRSAACRRSLSSRDSLIGFSARRRARRCRAGMQRRISSWSGRRAAASR